MHRQSRGMARQPPQRHLLLFRELVLRHLPCLQLYIYVFSQRKLACLHQLRLCLLQLPNARRQLVVETTVLDGQGRGCRQGGQPVQVFRNEATVPAEVGHRQGADGLAADHERTGHGRAEELAPILGEHATHAARPRAVVVDEHALAPRGRRP